MRIPSLILALAALGATTVSAIAADAPPKTTHAVADLGYVGTAGNSQIQTLSGSEKLELLLRPWKLTQDGAAVWGSDDGTENAGRYLFGLRGDREVNSRLSVYALGSWRRNTFAGITRQFDEGAGLAYHALIPKPQQLDFEAGAGFAQRRSTSGLDENFGTGRLAALYRYYFQEKTYFETGGRYLHNFKHSTDYEWGTRTTLVAPLANHLAVKLAHDYSFRNTPPAGFKQWDSTFAAGVQLNW
ncbi:MAG: DUF481 domain-containing protein [Candidatus Eisenbacteria bacterium]|nr:DUF481 domain-containing protein [Candidatus Eisenbacteria bacterium]